MNAEALALALAYLDEAHRLERQCKRGPNNLVDETRARAAVARAKSRCWALIAHQADPPTIIVNPEPSP